MRIPYFRIPNVKLEENARARAIAPRGFAKLPSVEQIGIGEQTRRELQRPNRKTTPRPKQPIRVEPNRAAPYNGLSTDSAFRRAPSRKFQRY